MSIRRGQDWGKKGLLAPDAPLAASDAALADVLMQADTSWITGGGEQRDTGAPRIEVGLTGGDLHRTLGSPRHSEGDLRSGLGMRLPVDAVAVTLGDGPDEGQTKLFCAHLVATRAPRMGLERKLFDGHTVVAMNAAFRGSDNLAPRAHPGDGLIDTLEGSLNAGDRVRARRRYATGTHIPHPGIDTRRVREATFEFDSQAVIVLDGEMPIRAAVFSIRAIPDAVTVVV